MWWKRKDLKWVHSLSCSIWCELLWLDLGELWNSVKVKPQNLHKDKLETLESLTLFFFKSIIHVLNDKMHIFSIVYISSVPSFQRNWHPFGKSMMSEFRFFGYLNDDCDACNMWATERTNMETNMTSDTTASHSLSAQYLQLWYVGLFSHLNLVKLELHCSWAQRIVQHENPLTWTDRIM